MMDCRLIQGFVSTIEAGGVKVRPAGCDAALTPVLPMQAFQVVQPDGSTLELRQTVKINDLVAVALFSDGSGLILGKL